MPITTDVGPYPQVSSPGAERDLGMHLGPSVSLPWDLEAREERMQRMLLSVLPAVLWPSGKFLCLWPKSLVARRVTSQTLTVLASRLLDFQLQEMRLGWSPLAHFLLYPYIHEKEHKIMGKMTQDKEENEVTGKRRTQGCSS